MYDFPKPHWFLKGRGCPSPSPGVSRPAGSPKAARSPAGITEIIMNRPHARNALGKVLVSEVRKGRPQGRGGGWGWGWGWAGQGAYLTWSSLQLLEAVAQLREDRQVRVLLFRSGVKGVFCAGGFPPLTQPQGSAGLSPACSGQVSSSIELIIPILQM